MDKSKIPTDAKRIALRPIALGERTGHHHSLMENKGVLLEEAAEMFEVETDSGLKTMLRVTKDGVSLVHQQHKAHAVRPIEYAYRPQVENSDWGTRQVMD